LRDSLRVVVALILHILIAWSFCPFRLVIADSSVIRVPQDYPTIQGAINAASSGDTILVSAGTYYEKVWVNKSVSLIAEEAYNACRMHFIVRADNVTINGFTTEVGPGSGIELLDSNGCNISNNIVQVSIHGIGLYNSDNNLIEDNTVSCRGEAWGISLVTHSDNNIVRGNRVGNASFGSGILLIACDNNIVEQNGVANFYDGIMLDYSDYNVIRGNTFQNTEWGIALSPTSKDNCVYHNNLVNNYDHAVDYGGNRWDNGAEGNYYDNYNGTDLDGDGIGDTYLPWEGVDSHPLMVPWSPIRTFHTVVNETSYAVTVHSNSTIASFDYNQSLRRIGFNATGPQGTAGFCNITIPKALLDGRFLALVDGEAADYTLTKNETHCFVYFTYTHSTRKIKLVEYNKPLLGDLNYDGRVTLYDIVAAAAAYGTTPHDPDWNPLADVAPLYERIDIYDLVTIAYHYGETYP
jgi:nitrous oxidase accessory protein